VPIQSRPGSSFVTKAATPHPLTRATLTGEARRQAEEREAHILGDGPRLQPIELNEVSSGLLKILERMETVNDVLQSSAEGDRGGTEPLRAQVLADPKAAASSPEVLASLNSLPEIVLTMLHHADLFALHTDVGLQLLARGALSFREREFAVLRIA
jgi:hypothetical protein